MLIGADDGLVEVGETALGVADVIEGDGEETFHELGLDLIAGGGGGAFVGGDAAFGGELGVARGHLGPG